MKQIFIHFAFSLLSSGWLLYYVWLHAHWSVAFIVSYLTARIVFEDLIDDLEKYRKSLETA